MFSQQLNTFSQSLFGFGEQPLTRTNNYHEHVEGVTSVVLVVEGEKLHVIKDVSRSTKYLKINID